MKQALLILLAFLFGCWHATHVTKPDDDGAAQGEQKQPSKAEGGTASKPRQARRPARPGRPPLAVAPGGLYAPGAIEQIQQALQQRGYLEANAESGKIDETTSAAVRKFQGDQDLARTGVPDHETVRKLGLDPDKVFRQSNGRHEDKQ